jgi:hypothetical protein
MLLLITSCQKGIDVIAESQGTDFNILLKTVVKSADNPAYNSTTLYNYNATGQAIVVTRSTSSAKQIETYYRKANGKLDSIVVISITNSQTTIESKTEFNYDVSGNISFSLYRSVAGWIDSCVYSYQAGQIAQRILYKKAAGANNYLLLHTLSYTYDAAGNLSQLNAVWTNPILTHNCTYTYDLKQNSLPVLEYENELYGFWTTAYYHDYRLANNILKRRSTRPNDWDLSDIDYEYKYAANNKPLYQKAKIVGTPQFYEIFYYYD